MASTTSTLLTRKSAHGFLSSAICPSSFEGLKNDSRFRGIMKTEEPFVKWVKRELNKLKVEGLCDFDNVEWLNASIYDIGRCRHLEDVTVSFKIILGSHYETLSPLIDGLESETSREFFICTEQDDDGVRQFTVSVLKISSTIRKTGEPELATMYKKFRGHYEVKSQ